jgi:DNA-binding SARP family transcriptional activator/tetratricopeptide (TPR) repeat protein/TolB-like protein
VTRLITFGGLSARNGTVINGVANPRSRLAILAVLAVAGDRGIRREKLAAMFWPDSDEERARTALRQALFTLKKDIGSGEITLGGSDLRLNPEVLTADVTDFDMALREERYADAAALYSGPFLDGVFLRESPDFERWAEEQRARLSSAFGRALERAAAEASRGGDHRTAADWWEKRVRHDPLSGRVARHYMEALVIAGDRERAILHAAVHAQLVRQELEADPDPEVLALAGRLRETNGGSRSAATIQDSVERANAPSTGVESSVRVDTIETSAVRRLFAGSGTRAALTLAVAAGLVFAVQSLFAKGPPVQRGLVAIGEFENRTGDSTLNALARLASARVLEVLTQSGHGGVLDLRLGPTGSMLAARDVAAQARRSAAEYLVRGAIERRGDSLLVMAQVVLARSGAIRLQVAPISVASVSRDLILDEVRERLGGAVVALGDTAFPLWEMGRSRPPRYSAYNEFRQGIDAVVTHGMEVAAPHFLKSMALDTTFAQAKLWYLEQAFGLDGEEERVDSVRAALEAQRATFVAYDQVATDRQLAFIDGRLEDVYTAARQMLLLAPDSPDAKMILAQASYATRRYREAINVLHSVRSAPAWMGGFNQRRFWDLSAHRLLGDLNTGIAEWRQAVAEVPDRVNVCALGIPLLAAAGLESSVDSLLLACERLPDARMDTDGNLATAGRNYRMTGHHDAAQRAFRRALAFRTELAATGGRPRYSLARLFADLGEWQNAYDILRTLRSPDEEQRVALGVAAAHIGDTATARETMRWLETTSKREGAEMNRAFIELALGQRDQAIASLRAAITSGVAPGWNAWYLRPELAPLRGDPRFEDLIRPIR